MKVVNLIAGPRNLSTALMYSFAQSENMQVLDEPFYGYYLKNAHLKVVHPSQKEVMETMMANEDKIIKNINQFAEQSDVFVKGMAHHYLMKKPIFLLEWENVLLVRHPKKLITSFSKVIPNPTLDDIGLKKSSQLFVFLKENGKMPLVIDSDELLKNPETYLKKLCAKLHVPFTKKMLCWEKGGIPEDGIWAKHWYGNLHNSEGFDVKKTSSNAFPEHLEPLLEEAMPFYEILKGHVLLN